MTWIEYYPDAKDLPWYEAQGYGVVGPMKPTWHTWEEGDHLCVKRTDNKDKFVVRKEWK